jgi:hypothetical protein
LLSVGVAHDVVVRLQLGRPRRREAAFCHCGRQGTRSSCKTNRNATTAWSNITAPSGTIQPILPSITLTALGGQMPLYKLTNIAKSMQRRDGRDFQRSR